MTTVCPEIEPLGPRVGLSESGVATKVNSECCPSFSVQVTDLQYSNERRRKRISEPSTALQRSQCHRKDELYPYPVPVHDYAYPPARFRH